MLRDSRVSVRGCARPLWLAAFQGIVLAGLSGAAFAQEPTEAATRWREVWSGADVTSSVWLLYSGATISPNGDVYSNGIRFRTAAGFGGYEFDDDRINNGAIEQHRFKADTAFADVMVGYQYRFGELTAKAFVGVSAIAHNIREPGALTAPQGLEYGPKVATEFWLNLGPDAWTSLDLSWTSAHDTYAARTRTGYRVLPTLTAGVEAGVNATGEHMDGRGGLFLRYEWAGGEISASAGLSGDIGSLELTDELSPYATINWLTQF